VSLSSLARYRRSLGDFVRALPMRLEENAGRRAQEAPAPPAAQGERDRQVGGLRAIDGGLA
jgi:hypothetical protein